MNDEYIVELEPGVWIAAIAGDPGRTLRKENAKRFSSGKDARRGITAARKYRAFIAAIVSHVPRRLREDL